MTTNLSDIFQVENTIKSVRFSKYVKRYQYLMSNLFCVDVSSCQEFQKTYNCFFQLRRNLDYRRIHFDFLQQNKSNGNIDFEQILIFLSAIQGSMEASFATKMLSIINTDMPVWDSKVIAKLNSGIYDECKNAVMDKLSLTHPPKSSPSRTKDAVALYKEICRWNVE
ncbi:MAG: hypothetical protein FWD86_03075, partial [Firmicutes bacterium]|nr:hypothetical protein [Bacillota bacterium]